MIRRAPTLFALCAFAALGQTQTDPRDLWFKKTEPPSAAEAPQAAPLHVAVPRGYALVIGISRYKNLREEAQLKFAENDAAGIYSTLISPEAGQFPPENIKRLIGSQATLANIANALEVWLPAVSRNDDRVLIYFAGHGFVHDGKAYLAPYDVDGNDIAGTAYPMDRLGEYFGSKIKAKWRVLLTDACHSGAITPASDPQTVSTRLAALNPSVFSLTASRDREQSFEGTLWGGGHGVFTYYVIQGLQGEADSSGDGAVSADELAEYVHTNVRRDTQARQNPTSDRGSFDPRMVLAYNPAGVRVRQPEQSAFGRLVIETNRDGVEVFVDGKSRGVVDQGKPLLLPGMSPGAHTIQGVHQGYEPDGPREELVYPGQDTTVTIRIQVIRRTKPMALEMFNKGLSAYTAGGQKNYTNAAEYFEKALVMDPAYSQAALYLGSANNALFDQDKADRYFRRAIEIDPDYTEARARYGGMLLDRGDFDGAIRQLDAVIGREPGRALAHYMLSVAFARKEAYGEAIREAREAVRLAPTNGEAYFALGEALRKSGQCADAEPEYTQYLKLSNFDSGLAAKLGDILLATGRKKAAQHDIWMELRNQANFGLCDCARIRKQVDSAVGYCRAALTYDKQDPFAHYVLGVLLAEKYNSGGGIGLLAAARQHFAAVIEFNSEMEESTKARKYIGNIDAVLARP
jgi:tetratricopeptide (TPR) repeat protein